MTRSSPASRAGCAGISEKHGVAVGDLHMSMPISLRTEHDEMGGNRITLMRFDVAVGVADPAQRVALIHEGANKVRHERSLPYRQLIAGALNLMPRWYIGSILRHVDFVASDVPGVPVPVFLGGAGVRKQFAFGPTIGAAVNVTLLTFVGTCELGIDATPAQSPTPRCFSTAWSRVSTRCWRWPRDCAADQVGVSWISVDSVCTAYAPVALRGAGQ